MRDKRTGIIVQARMSSTRLPGKVMKLVMGKTLLEHLIDRLKKVSGVDEIIIATTEKPTDDIIVETATSLGIKVSRGSENDVLERYYLAAKEFGIDTIVRVTSDCPLIDPLILESLIDKFNGSKADFMSTAIKEKLPLGLGAELFTFETLERVYRSATQDYQREHVMPYVYENPSKFTIISFDNGEDLSSYRLTVDTQEDLDLVREIYKRLYPENPVFGLDDIISLLKKEPGLADINRTVKQKHWANK